MVPLCRDQNELLSPIVRDAEVTRAARRKSSVQKKAQFNCILIGLLTWKTYLPVVFVDCALSMLYHYTCITDAHCSHTVVQTNR